MTIERERGAELDTRHLESQRAAQLTDNTDQNTGVTPASDAPTPDGRRRIGHAAALQRFEAHGPQHGPAGADSTWIDRTLEVSLLGIYQHGYGRGLDRVSLAEWELIDTVLDLVRNIEQRRASDGTVPNPIVADLVLDRVLDLRDVLTAHKAGEHR